MAKSRVSKYLIGAGVAAAVAAGIVGFLTQTKKGKQVVKEGRKYASEIAKQVAKKAEQIKRLSQAQYEELVDDVVGEYRKKRKMTEQTAAELARQLKKEWQQVKRELKKF